MRTQPTSAALQLPSAPLVLAIQEEPFTVELTLDIAENLICFQGHYPEFPLVPGVAQLAWAVNFAETFFKLSKPVKEIERLKFTCPIRPKMQIQLKLTLDAEKKSARFQFYYEQQTFSQGCLIYE